MFLTFGISRTFYMVLDVDEELGINYASSYIPLICTLGTLISIFNQGSIGMLLAEGKTRINVIRSLASSFLTLLF